MRISSVIQNVACCILSCSAACSAQGSAGTKGKLEPRWLVDVPTAGMLSKGSVCLDVDFYQEGGVLLCASFGVFDRVSLGASYGGSKLIGGDTPVMNETPGMNVRIRLLEESFILPALVLGFDSQGNDGYLKELDRYRIKSPGFYAVVSKNYSFVGYLSLHGGANYSLERSDGDEDLNVFAGLEKTLGPIASLVLEYNLAANDSRAVGRGRGYLNAGLRWIVGGGLTLGVNLKDLAKNGGDVSIANRTVHIEYIKPL